jgi:TPR repeat protein
MEPISQNQCPVNKTQDYLDIFTPKTPLTLVTNTPSPLSTNNEQTKEASGVQTHLSKEAYQLLDKPNKPHDEPQLARGQGDALGQYNYGVMLREGEGGEADLQEARVYLKLSADQGYAKAQIAYALMLQKGEGGEADLPLARTYFKLAADQGDTLAAYHYGLMLRDGEGGEVNLKEAREYLKLAAGQGH